MNIQSIRRRRRNATLRAKALTVAKSQIGVKESPPDSNRGPKVDQYLAAADLGGQAQPWCAAFVTWCYAQAGVKLDGWNVAYCPAWLQHSRSSSKLMQILPRHARPGDVVLFDWQDDRVADHIGFLTSRVDQSGTFSTVEGNTSTGSAGSQSNGGCVAARRRNVRDVIAFLRVVPS